jgi:hypothetical protein
MNFAVAILLITYMAVHGEHKGFSLGAGYEMYAIFSDHTENCLALNIGTQLNRHYIGAFVSNDEDWSFFTTGGKYAFYLLQAKYFGAFLSASGAFLRYRIKNIKDNQSVNFAFTPEVGIEAGFPVVRVQLGCGYVFIGEPCFLIRAGGKFYF